jgi:hypothetical protein
MPIEKPFPDGVAQVTFDAGGQATYVNPNPVRPILEGGLLVVRWTLGRSPLHGNEGFEVFFGNVVPCNRWDAYLAGLQSEGDPYGQVWTWKWPAPQIMPSPEEGVLLYYDMFFCYEPKPLAGGKRPHRHVQTVSLREIMSADPTMILPPKAGGGQSGPRPK